ncbi:hypothetical protein ACFV1N_16335 [Streptosporangium canum]|uniref:hypothetical protein n=1 Tax=Streptosporangium canum TaxID=324952 RepID=UPI00367F9AC2
MAWMSHGPLPGVSRPPRRLVIRAAACGGEVEVPDSGDSAVVSALREYKVLDTTIHALSALVFIWRVVLVESKETRVSRQVHQLDPEGIVSGCPRPVQKCSHQVFGERERREKTLCLPL